MSNLVQLYREYIEAPTMEGFERFFLDVIEAKENVSDQLLDLYFTAQPLYVEHKHLISNGSSSMRDEDRKYWFGPYFNPVRLMVERFLRTRSFEPYLKLVLTTRFPDKERLIEPGRIIIDMTDKNCGYDVIEAIESQRVPGQTVCLYTFPTLIQRLNSLDYLLDYLINSRYLIVTSSNREAFYNDKAFLDRGIVVNDHMINWRSGVAFYTCQHNRRHLLPNLYGERHGRFYNLLNLNCKDGTPVDDVIEHSDVSCPCGRAFVIKGVIPHFEFVPRRKDGSFLYDLSFAKKVTSHWYTMQFLDDGGGCECMYTGEEALDKELVESHFGVSVKMIPDTLFAVGSNKSFTFWNRRDLIKLSYWL